MKIFDKFQTSVSSEFAGMNQYVNESNSPIQLSRTGDYLGPQMAVVSFENSFISRALKLGKLRNAGPVVVDEPKSKKSKKSDIPADVAEELAVSVAVEESAEEIQKELPEEDSVVAIETTEA